MNSIVLLKFVPVDAREKSKGLILNPADGAALETALSLAGMEGHRLSFVYGANVL